ncbi:MAG: CoA transferase [Chloroflexi bacterium]|nr:CoA transferase [Chloroflexota bacterium]
MGDPLGLLSGLKVLDLTHYAAGPYATRMMAAQGAEVTKIERPGAGDPARHIGPFPGDDPDPEQSALFLYLNTSKKSITLNLNTTSGTETLKRLLVSADVLVENFQPGVMASMGLDYPQVESVNPRLVMASITYFGQTGPYKSYKGNSMVGFAVTGQMHMTGDPDKEPLVGAGYQPEYQAGLHAYDAVLAALYWRETSGKGQHIDVSVMEAMAYYHEFAITTWTHVKALSIRAGNNYPVGNHPLTIYLCKDGYISISCVTPRQSESLFLLIERPDLIDDPKLGTGTSRWENRDEFDEIILPWLMERTMDEIVTAAQDLRIPCTYVPTFGQLFQDRQLRARDYWVALEHPLVGRHTYAGAPFKMDQTPMQVTRAPLLGEHNEEVYCGDLGCSKEDLVRLRERNII